jgi:hypothetical protein
LGKHLDQPPRNGAVAQVVQVAHALGYLLAKKHFPDPLTAVPSAVGVFAMARYCTWALFTWVLFSWALFTCVVYIGIVYMGVVYMCTVYMGIVYTGIVYMGIVYMGIVYMAIVFTVF